jgi:hypothetical protein
MLVMDVFTRRTAGFGIAPASIDGMSVCHMFSCATGGQSKPKYLSTDHDPLFRFRRWLANLRVLEVEEMKSVPCAPVSHPFVERPIGTIRREYFDQVFFWNAADLALTAAEAAIANPNCSSEMAAWRFPIQSRASSSATTIFGQVKLPPDAIRAKTDRLASSQQATA